MVIKCKKTGEEYAITDREIGEKIECPCCGEKFVVDDALLPKNVYEAALIRKSEAIAIRDEPACDLYRRGSEGKYAKLFDCAQENDDAEAQFQLAKWLYDSERSYSLAAYWFARASKRNHAEARRRLAECHGHGFGVKQDDGREEVQNHISDLLAFERRESSEEYVKGLYIWRKSINMNCPVCEASIELPTRLMGAKARCPECHGEFMARGEGIMTTSERNRHRFESRFDEEAKLLATRFQSCRSAVKAILQKLGLDYDKDSSQYVIFGSGNGVGYGSLSPWMGVCLHIEWCSKGIDVRPCLSEIRDIVESVLGFWVRLTLRLPKYGPARMEIHVRHNRPCEQNAAFMREMEMWKVDDHKEVVHPLVASREAEQERLEYLLGGDIHESLSTDNHSHFGMYLEKMYHVDSCLVINLPPNDRQGVAFGFKDGFGVVVNTKRELANEIIVALVSDMEKQTSRTMTLANVVRSADKFQYCFVLSMPNKSVAKPSSQELSRPAGLRDSTSVETDRSSIMKPSTTAKQYLGKGTGVDWSKENAAFARFADEYGISGFNVRAVNPYCVQVSIPLSVDEDDVRDFANDLFDELGLLSGGDIDFHQFGPCCFLDKSDDCYYVVFNHHSVVGSKAGDADYKFTVEAVQEGGDEEYSEDEITPEKVMQYIAAGIKSGAIRSKSGEGFFVLEGKYYDQIAAGKKTTEYRDITPSNLSKSIGIKTVKLQRGYKKVQMRYAVESVRLMDANDRECDPYNIPAGFIATTIAIHLGKRIA